MISFLVRLTEIFDPSCITHALIVSVNSISVRHIFPCSRNIGGPFYSRITSRRGDLEGEEEKIMTFFRFLRYPKYLCKTDIRDFMVCFTFNSSLLFVFISMYILLSHPYQSTFGGCSTSVRPHYFDVKYCYKSAMKSYFKGNS